MIWDKTYIDLGKIKAGKAVIFTFRVLDTKDKKVFKITSSCGCSKPKLNLEDKMLTIRFKTDSVPPHLLYIVHYIVNKTIKVLYTDGTFDILSYRATILK